MFKKTLLVFCAIWFGITASFASETQVTVYNQNIALIKVEAKIHVKRGIQNLNYKKLPPALIPGSVNLREIDGASAFRIIQHTFMPYSTLKDNLLKKYLRRPIQLILPSGELISGKLLKYSGNTFFLKRNGNLELIPEIKGTRIIFPNSPDSLGGGTLLQWEIEGLRPAAPNVELSYLTSGLNWTANYRAVVLGEDRLRLSAEVSIRNHSGASYRNAHVKLVAGQINKAYDRPIIPFSAALKTRTEAAARDAGRGISPARTFSEYHIYDLRNSVSLPDNQTVAIPFIKPVTVPMEKTFWYDSHYNRESVRVKIKIKNKKSARLGQPLPAGIVRLYRDDLGHQEFVGEDLIKHTPEGETVTLTAGMAFDIFVKRAEQRVQKISEKSEVQTVSLKIHNRKKRRDVSVKVVEHLAGRFRYWKITSSSLPYRQTGEREIRFDVPVKAHGETTLTYKVTFSR